jgi:hypothetical protein
MSSHTADSQQLTFALVALGAVFMGTQSPPSSSVVGDAAPACWQLHTAASSSIAHQIVPLQHNTSLCF